MLYDDIHATTVREAVDRLNDILFVVVNHLICTNRARPLELLVRPRRGEDPRAVQTRDLNRRLTDPAPRGQHQHVRHRGTIGGSLANNDPAADYPAAVLALNATVVTNKRQIKADDFFKGLFATALGADEIVTRIAFPIASKFAYAKFANPASRYALVGVAVAQPPSGVRVAVTGASASGVYRATDMEAALAKGWSAQSLDGLAGDAAKMMSDIHADAQYRAHLVGVMARRAVAASGP